MHVKISAQYFRSRALLGDFCKHTFLYSCKLRRVKGHMMNINLFRFLHHDKHFLIIQYFHE